ncbi:MAG: hypothetical protein QOG66_203 [Methylobacteriaceae bacterium]|jgi:hypothetical protein|nr:hypothetical protein [Methylobacteriaceae bacterium]MEA2861368.1 hypothetical protein [Methylobacteriaceae bacterium]
MKKMVFLAAVGTFAFVGAALADKGGTPNANSNGNGSCFGQARAAYASGPQPLGSVGSIVSDRAQTDVAGYPNGNVAANQQFKDACNPS